MIWLLGLALAGIRPAPLSSDGCDLYAGTAAGNDPSVEVHLRVCPSSDGVTGALQWSSLTSGWNVREIRGGWSGDRLALRDVAILEEKPEPGWRFCTVDRYELVRSGQKLTGTYASAACTDTGSLSLTLIEQAGGESVAPVVAPVPAPLHPAPDPVGPALPSVACGCSHPGGLGLPPVLLLVALTRRRRSRP